jgi:hypothetical protein
MKISRAWWLILGLLPWSMASAGLPYTFKAGDPIRASELNANFQYLDSAAAGDFGGTLIRKKATLSTTRFTEVTTVPDTATNGWVLRSFAVGCTGLQLRLDTDPEFPLESGTPLVVRPGEVLYAKCGSSGTSLIGYFMFNEQ